MSSGKKWTSPNPTAYDVLTLHNCLFTDLGLFARTHVKRKDREHIEVVTEVYRDIDGVLFGICKFGEVCNASQGDITPLIYRTLLHGYWRAHDMAHTDPHGRTRYGKR